MVTFSEACRGGRASVMAEEIRSHKTSLTWDAYHLGRGVLVLATDDDMLRLRFQQKFAECACPVETDSNSPQVRCEIRTDYPLGRSLVSFSELEPLDSVGFALCLFPDGEYVECFSYDDDDGWRRLALSSTPATPVLAIRAGEILVDHHEGWQGMVARYAVSNVLRLQKDLIFLHAASVAIGKSGVLISGAKGAGKTTLSLTLASQGHGFLGDEYAALCTDSSELIPVRASASIRHGPCTAELREYFGKHECEQAVNLDGTERVWIRVSDIFPEAQPHSVPLTHLFFLRRFSTRPYAEPFTPQSRHLSLFSPLAATLWDVSAGHRAVEFLRLLAKARCFYLDVGGTPDDTADLIETTVEESWV